jgi:hypothetical protein
MRKRPLAPHSTGQRDDELVGTKICRVCLVEIKFNDQNDARKSQLITITLPTAHVNKSSITQLLQKKARKNGESNCQLIMQEMNKTETSSQTYAFSHLISSLSLVRSYANLSSFGCAPHEMRTLFSILVSCAPQTFHYAH